MIRNVKLLSSITCTCLSLFFCILAPIKAHEIIARDLGLFVITDLNDVDTVSLDNYSAIAVQIDLIENDYSLQETVRKAFSYNDARIYLFGDLTINDYKRVLGIEKFGADAPVFDENGITAKTAFISFGYEQESSDIFNIISFSKNDTKTHLLAKVAKSEKIASGMTNEYIKIIVDDFQSTESTKSTTIVKSGFNYRSYLTSSAYANMDFILYRDLSELDPNYDYFAIKTNVCTVGMSTARIETEHRLPFDSDELIDYGPGDITRAGSVSVSLDLGSGFEGGGVSYSFEVGGGPTIDASYNAVDDFCSWTIKRYWWFGGDLVNELFSLGSSWASTGTYAGTNVKFRALFDYGIDSFYSPWTTVQIRYDY